MKTYERVANLALFGLSLTPLIVKGVQLNTGPQPIHLRMISNERAMPILFIVTISAFQVVLQRFVAYVKFTRSHVVISIPGTFFCIWYALKKHCLANNILGIAFCIQGIEMMSLGSFKTSAIPLAGVFFYDIFWVFFTPVMTSLAKSAEAPVKLLFPTSNAARPFSVLGLGDIVMPGIFVALALRFDLSRGRQTLFFNSAFLGYTAGLVVAIIVKNLFQAAQPALLYIVPGIVGFVAARFLWNGKVKPLLEYDESKFSTDSRTRWRCQSE